MVSDSVHDDLNLCFRNDDCCITYNELNLDQAEWYDAVDVNSIGLIGYYEPLSHNDEVYNEVEVYNIPDDAMVWHNNFEPLFKLGDPHKYKMYDHPWAQMDYGAKCTITNNINLLKNLQWYNQWFWPRARMKGALSDNIITPQSKGHLQVPTIQEGKFIDVKCYYSMEFTSTLFLDNYVIHSSKFGKEYCGKSMLTFFEPEEEVPVDQQDQIRNQKMDEVVKQYDHNYGNCILSCTHKNKFNKNVYIPGIIHARLCYTMPLIIPSGLKLSDPGESVFNSQEKAYTNDKEFKNKCDLLSMKLIYENQQREHIGLMNVLESVLGCFN